MSNSTDFTLHQEEIHAFPESLICRAAMPIATYCSEAETLFKVATEDSAALIEAGFDQLQITNLSTLAGATREAQSLWNADRFSKEDAQTAWNAHVTEAFEMKEECISAFQYAFRTNEHLLGRVDAIIDGTGQPDLVQDLNDISVLGEEQNELLEKINFPQTTISKAGEMAHLMAELLAEKGSLSSKNERRVVRDKAYSLLKQTVDEIYACGQYVFRKNSERKKLYKSAYRYNKNRQYYKRSK